MKTIDDQELQLTPSTIKALGSGETLAVTHKSAVVAFVIPAQASMLNRPAGLAKGEFSVPPDFNDPLPEIEDSIYSD